VIYLVTALLVLCSLAYKIDPDLLIWVFCWCGVLYSVAQLLSDISNAISEARWEAQFNKRLAEADARDATAPDDVDMLY